MTVMAVTAMGIQKILMVFSHGSVPTKPHSIARDRKVGRKALLETCDFYPQMLIIFISVPLDTTSVFSAPKRESND